MLINTHQELSDVFKEVKSEIRRATVDKKHPFRFVVLSTCGNYVRSRYVVLRAVDQDFRLAIYTDSRSEKIEDLITDPMAQLLFYHPKKQVQVLLTTEVEIHDKDELAKTHWKKVNGSAQKAYNSIDPPGTVVDNPTEGHRWKEQMDNEHFSVLILKPKELEVLQLNRSEHLRASFNIYNNWKGEWLVP